jgi:hypothetical protein
MNAVIKWILEFILFTVEFLIFICPRRVKEEVILIRTGPDELTVVGPLDEWEAGNIPETPEFVATITCIAWLYWGFFGHYKEDELMTWRDYCLKKRYSKPEENQQ